MLSFHRAVESDFLAVNEHIVQELHSDVGLVENIGHYIIEAGGKRLRPLIVLLVAKCLGYSGRQHVELATIIEFIHTATLLHDDVVDVSALRRGRPTANATWGNASSVLVGDFLYSRAFQLLVRIGSMEIMRVLSETTNIISEGEVQQLVNAKNPDITENDYLSVIYKKTAALFEAAADTASVLSEADDDTRRAATAFGRHLGNAFQLVDDVLDYSGDSETMGKNIGDDLSEGKATLPLIYAMRQAKDEDRAFIANALRTGDNSNIEKISDIVVRYDGLSYARSCATREAEQALQSLSHFPNNSLKTTLVELTQFSLDRSF